MEKKIIAGFKNVPDVEDERRVYREFPDGLRLIYENGTYSGYYHPLSKDD